MDLLKAQLDRLSRQLSGLSASQKMLTAALVAIMAMTLVWWGKYAGDPEMEPVLDQSFSAPQIEQISANLASRGIRYSVSGDRILVPTDRKYEVLAALSLAHLMPRDTSSGFDDMLKSASNPFNPDTVNQKLFNHGKEVELSQIIQNFPNVSKAEVLIDPTREMHYNGSVEPSATIAITMEDGASADDNLVNAAADLVQGAQSGIARSQIKVIVGGVPRRLRDASDMSGDGDETLELQQKAEVARENRIKDYLSYIPDLKVFVTMKVNSTATQVHQTDYDGKKKVSAEVQSTNDTIDTTAPGGAPAGADPGVVSNVQTPGSVVGGGLNATATTSNEEKTSTTSVNFVPSTVTDTKTNPGDVSIVAATVRVPMTYFEAIYAHQNPDARPTDADLAPLVTAELPKIRNDVMKCTGLVSEKDVAVETYMDATPIKPVEAQAASALSVSSILGSHGRDLILGGLAFMSLFMVSMMVRKATPQLAVPVAAGAGGGSVSIGGVAAVPGSLNSDEAIAGEAGGVSTLAGMELDEETVRSQQMLEQVSSMVKENPDVAATLVKRWMNRT
jgi:flagellar biosynthesis/type III secretory pathway M-ring protein FliF/YscJ